MKKAYVAKQKIFDRKGNVFAYELLFRDNESGIKEFPSDITATSNVLMNILTNFSIDQILEGSSEPVFINVDDKILQSGIIDILDKDRFVLEVLETVELTPRLISKIKAYYKKGFKFALDDFDCSLEMFKKFSSLFKYVDIVKMDMIAAKPENIDNTIIKMKKANIKVLAEKIETKDECRNYVDMNFDLFQGYYLGKPKTIEIDKFKDATRLIILELIKLIKDDSETYIIESFIKKRSDLSYKLIKFINNHDKFEVKIESITQIITLLGRDRLLRWLLLYLYSEISHDPVSEALLKITTRRAETMEENATQGNKDKAYIAGMFSMLGTLFDTDIKNVIKDVKMDKDIENLVVYKKGKFLSGLLKSEQAERDYLKKLFLRNYDKIDPTDIIYTLSLNGIEIEKDDI